jgi:hypothetical protein
MTNSARLMRAVSFENIGAGCYYGRMISIKEIEKLASLSRIELTAEEKESLRKDMDAIWAC